MWTAWTKEWLKGKIDIETDTVLFLKCLFCPRLFITSKTFWNLNIWQPLLRYCLLQNHQTCLDPILYPWALHTSSLLIAYIYAKRYSIIGYHKGWENVKIQSSILVEQILESCLALINSLKYSAFIQIYLIPHFRKKWITGILINHRSNRINTHPLVFVFYQLSNSFDLVTASNCWIKETNLFPLNSALINEDLEVVSKGLKDDGRKKVISKI